MIKSLSKKRNKARYRDIIDGLDKITKLILLLGGEATERIQVYGWGKAK